MNIDDLNPEIMQRRFHALGQKREEILAVSMPMREARDVFWQETAATLAEMNARIKEAEVGLFEIDQARGMIARALNGQTGSPE